MANEKYKPKVPDIMEATFGLRKKNVIFRLNPTLTQQNWYCRKMPYRNSLNRTFTSRMGMKTYWQSMIRLHRISCSYK